MATERRRFVSPSSSEFFLLVPCYAWVGLPVPVSSSDINTRPEMAQKERKKRLQAKKYFLLPHIQIVVKCFDLVSICPGDTTWTIYVRF
jgi:hypothetical protein